MSDTLIALLPFIIGSAVVPLQIVLIILLLKNPHQGLIKALAFVLGMTIVRVLQGVVFGLILGGGSEAAAGEAGGKGPIVSTLLLVLGLLLLISAYKKWNKEVDPDDPPPAWLSSFDRITASRALMFGALLPLLSPKLWVFTLSAIGAIRLEQLGQAAGTIAFLLFLLLAQSLLLLPVLVRILLPSQSKSMLQAASDWLTRYNRAIMIVVSLVFGLLFLYQGVSGLLA